MARYIFNNVFFSHGRKHLIPTVPLSGFIALRGDEMIKIYEYRFMKILKFAVILIPR